MSTQERPKQTLSDRADTAKRAVTRTLRRVGFDPMLVAHGNAFDDSERRTIRAVEPYTMTSPERIDAVCQATRYIERAGIEGDVVECGVWRGGSMMAVARTLLEIGAPDRELYLYDTFAGMTEPSEMDTDRRGRTAMSQIKGLEPGGAGSEWCNASLPDVEINLRKTGYPMGKVHFVPGLVEETIPQTIPERIAFLRLDTDWYESTKHELEHLMPRLAPGGVLILDDYGHWQGARKAVDEYLEANDLPLLLSRVDYTARMAVMPGRGGAKLPEPQPE